MLKDNYLEDCKKAYAVKAGEIIGPRYDEAYLVYTHALIDDSAFKKIIAAFRKELSRELKDGVTLTVIKTSRVPRMQDRINDFDKDWIEEKVRTLSYCKENDTRWAREIIEILDSFPHLFNTYKETLKALFLKSSTKSHKNSIYLEQLKTFSETFKLSGKEQDLITFLYLDKTDDQVDDYFTGRDIDVTNVAKNIKYFCRFFTLTPEALRSILSKESTLIKAGIITKSRRGDTIELAASVTAYLSGLGKNSLEEDYVKELNTTEALNISDHNILGDKVSAIKNLLSVKGGCNILLYGHPGTGKTEFSKSLAKETGKKVYFINQADPDGEESLDFRKQAIIAAHNIINPEEAIIVVDECDKIINIYDGMWKCDNSETSDRKAWVNEFLENSRHKIIWISNRVNGIDESTKRRYSFSLEFMPLSFTQRKKVWETQIKKQGIQYLDESDISSLSKSLKVNSGGITLALKDVEGMKSLETKAQKVEVLKTILNQHQAFVSGDEAQLIKKSSKYDLSVVNSDYLLEKLLSHADQFLKNKNLFEEKGVFNLNLLLQGSPGTGKTEFVKHLAESMDRELIVKRASDIQSKWVGESVKNIAQSFKEAQEARSILFFDEADSFFSAREGASEYRAENTNEFLTQMENFQGILVCATNFTQNLDQAAMRRFNYKVKFDYLTNAAKLKMFETYFSSQCSDWDEKSSMMRLEKIQGLTPGDFKVVFQKNVFNELRPTSTFLDELAIEVSYKKGIGKKVGLN